ncbi:hypothetical protein FEM48_Zijuj02G0206900 [Ziziphus jujuba var. spinosa]|uniref:Uncharacterized protein n=1 Tax=Ziziphus jujuba var. spinosa TaxID=714518 RepID=A0A978VXV9_ZIZJJ|nr:hypothetical protein FEM48_Zijuj02G0206900 [Ziziphus jujuba var. spinosa]
MTSYFRSQILCDIVSEGYSNPAASTTLDDTQKKELDENQQKDSQALFVLQQTVADEIFPRIMGATTAKEAWDTLQEEFEGSVKEEPDETQGPQETNQESSTHQMQQQIESKDSSPESTPRRT